MPDGKIRKNMKLRLNVATVPHENNRPFIAGAGVLGALALIALVLLARETYVSREANVQLRSDTASLETDIRAERAHHQELQDFFNTKPVQQTLARAQFLNSLITERSFPWTKIFMDLEKTLPAGVHVVSIAPKLVNGRANVSMVIGASSEESKIQFLQAIEKSKNFSNVAVDDERTSEAPGDTDRVTVRLDFSYETT